MQAGLEVHFCMQSPTLGWVYKALLLLKHKALLLLRCGPPYPLLPGCAAFNLVRGAGLRSWGAAESGRRECDGLAEPAPAE